MVPVKRHRDVDDNGLEDESEEEGVLFGGDSDEEIFRSDTEDGEISEASGGPDGDRWATVAGKKKYQDFRFKKMKLDDV